MVSGLSDQPVQKYGPYLSLKEVTCECARPDPIYVTLLVIRRGRSHRSPHLGILRQSHRLRQKPACPHRETAGSRRCRHRRRHPPHQARKYNQTHRIPRLGIPPGRTRQPQRPAVLSGGLIPPRRLANTVGKQRSVPVSRGAPGKREIPSGPEPQVLDCHSLLPLWCRSLLRSPGLLELLQRKFGRPFFQSPG